MIDQTHPVYERVRATVASSDCDFIPKVKNAGEVIDGKPPVQIMHNGLKVIHGSYHGDWMSEIIRRLKGHHEPQEEKMFHQILEHVKPGGSMIELGSNWAYYSMWFNKRVKNAKNIMIEPNPDKFELGKSHFKLNKMKGEFLRGSVGAKYNKSVNFTDYDDSVYKIPEYTVDYLIKKFKLKSLDILHSDIQGAELEMLDGAQVSLQTKKIRYLVISTHNNSHFNCLLRLKKLGYKIIVQHSVEESTTADGLIIASNNDCIEFDSHLTGLKKLSKKAMFANLIKSVFNIDLQLFRQRTKLKLNKSKNSNKLHLLTAKRFDLLAKYLYVKHKDMGVDTDYFKKLYLEHVKVWNNFLEKDGHGEYVKKSSNEFLTKFDELIESIKKNGFNPDISKIWVDEEGNLLNGSHRAAICMYYDIDFETEIHSPKQGQKNANYEYFLNRATHVKTGLRRTYADRMALEYIYLKPNVYIATIFPAANGKNYQIEKLINSNGQIIYKKNIVLNQNGAFNLIKMMYKGEKWLGSKKTNFNGAWAKVNPCFPKNVDNPLRIYMFESTSLESVKAIKLKIRKLFDLGNHSIHITDNKNESLDLAQTFLNDNSLHFLNHSVDNHILTKFNQLLPEFKKILTKNKVDSNDVCVTSSAVMSAYGMRDCKDIDYIKKHNVKINSSNNLITDHDSDIKYYPGKIDDIIYNPKNHFYYDQLKFSSLKMISKMKKTRDESKDKLDLLTIKNFTKNVI